MNSYNSRFDQGCPLSSHVGMKKSLFSCWFKPKSPAPKAAKLTPEDIRRKLADYKRREGPVAFSGEHLYQVEEVEGQERPTVKSEAESA